MYRVILSDNNAVNIYADDFSVNTEKGRVTFSEGTKNIAVFNFNNIQGFYKVNQEKTK